MGYIIQISHFDSAVEVYYNTDKLAAGKSSLACARAIVIDNAHIAMVIVKDNRHRLASKVHLPILDINLLTQPLWMGNWMEVITTTIQHPT